MIDIEKTISLRGYDPLMLSHGSDRKVWSICSGCGIGRWLVYQSYSDLCHKCGNGTSEARKTNSDAQKQYHINNPAAGKDHSKRLLQYYTDNPEAVETNRLKAIEQWSDPEARKAARLRGIEQYADQLVRDAQSDQMKNSKAAKASQDRQRGGHDIIEHHFIYDYNNPENHTVKITRSQHMSHHLWMKRNGLEVSCINMSEQNKDMFKKRKYNGTKY